MVVGSGEQELIQADEKTLNFSRFVLLPGRSALGINFTGPFVLISNNFFNLVLAVLKLWYV